MKRLTLSVLLCALSAGCAAVPPPQVTTTNSYSSARQAEKVGQKRWITSSLYVCEGAPPATELTTIGKPPCVPTKAGSFTIISIANGRMVEGYLVKFDNGREGWVQDLDVIIHTDDEKGHKATLAEQAECNRKGGVRIGMSRSQVYASCWGKPRSVNLTRTAGGDHEQLVYPGNNYVYLTNGVVTSLQTSSR